MFVNKSRIGYLFEIWIIYFNTKSECVFSKACHLKNHKRNHKNRWIFQIMELSIWKLQRYRILVLCGLGNIIGMHSECSIKRNWYDLNSLSARDSSQLGMTVNEKWLRMTKGYMIRFSLSVAILDMTKPSNSSTPTNGSCVVNISNYQNVHDFGKSWVNEIIGKDLLIIG